MEYGWNYNYRGTSWKVGAGFCLEGFWIITRGRVSVGAQW